MRQEGVGRVTKPLGIYSKALCCSEVGVDDSLFYRTKYSDCWKMFWIFSLRKVLTVWDIWNDGSVLFNLSSFLHILCHSACVPSQPIQGAANDRAPQRTFRGGALYTPILSSQKQQATGSRHIFSSNSLAFKIPFSFLRDVTTVWVGMTLKEGRFLKGNS